MTVDNNSMIDKYTPLYNDKSYIKYKILILCVSILFLMIRFGAIIPDVNQLVVKGFKIINLPKTIAALYLVWMYIYFSFYQKYWSVIEKEIIKSKKLIFKEKIAQNILRETHKRLGHDFEWFEVNSLHLSSFLQFYISYAPISFPEYGDEQNHGSRGGVIDLKLKCNRKYIAPYLAEVYLRGPIVTAYLIPFSFPIIAWFICMLGGWFGSLSTIFSELSGNIS